jgi:hypothetical protein
MNREHQSRTICPECRDGELLDMGGHLLCQRCDAEVLADE